MNAKRLAILLLIFICLFFNSAAYEQSAIAKTSKDNVVTITDLDKKVNLDSYIEVLTLESIEHPIEEVASGKYNDKFKRYKGKGRPNFGYNLHSNWVRINIQNQSSKNNWLLEFEAPKINELRFFTLDSDSNQFEAYYTGNNYPFLERDVEHRNFVLPIDIETGETKTIYMLVFTGSSIQIPLNLWDYNAFHAKSLIEYAILGGLFGLSIVMALYNLFLYFSIRDRSYLFYVLFVMLNTLLFLVDTGLGYQYLWPHRVNANSINVTELMYLSNIGGLLFIRTFLSTKKRMRKLDAIFKILIMLNIICFIVRQFTFAGAVYASTALVIISIFLIIYSSALSLWRGFRPARYLLFAWGFFLLGVFVSLMVDIGMIRLTFLTKYAWQITTALEVILLSFALGDKYKVFREEKERAVQEANDMQREALENLKRMDKLKDEFLTITSHELRTPLNGIIGIAETMRDGATGKLNSRMEAHLSMIISSGKRLFHLINDISDYSVLKNEQLKIKFKSVRLYELTNIVLTICQPLVKNKPIQLINKIDSDSNLTVSADENRIQQILYNIIGNAIKYTEKGSVTVSASKENNFIRIYVSDTGIGIPYEQQENIFKEFYQVADGETREYEGSGIGLNITKRLVEKHGGEIDVHSVVNQGSTFSFTLPIYEGEHLTEEISTTLSTFDNIDSTVTTVYPKANNLTKGKAKILIVDDDPVNLQVLMNQLNLVGYDVITASHGMEVLGIVQYEKVDLLILDIMMPKMSGFEVCQSLREKFSLIDLPILMLTAKTPLKDKIIAFEVGANDYLTKPCDRKELLTRVNTLIQLSRLNNELKVINATLEEKVKQRTNELEIANQHLEQMAETRTMLLANIAHDLGTPVTVIHNYLEAIDKGIINEEEKGQYLHLASSKIKVLNRLISDLFNLSILEAKQLKFNKREIALNSLVQEVEKKMELEVNQFNRQFMFSIEDITESFTIFIDEQRMDQVFSNLIWNAINHTSEIDGKIEVRVELDKENKKIIFEISDNGVGISDELIPFIFKRYYKVSTSTGNNHGTGVGLAIVREIVLTHDGRVWVESEEGVGSSFYVALPVLNKGQHRQKAVV